MIELSVADREAKLRGNGKHFVCTPPHHRADLHEAFLERHQRVGVLQRLAVKQGGP